MFVGFCVARTLLLVRILTCGLSVVVQERVPDWVDEGRRRLVAVQ